MSVLDLFRLDGHVAIVTGGGRGIGKGIAVALAEAGADVVVAARRTHEVEAVAAEIRALGRRSLGVPCDVLQPGAIESLVATTVAELGKLTIMVNNAGGNLDRTMRKLVDTPEDVWDTLIDFNLKTAWQGAKAAAPHIKAAGGGSIIGIVSTAAHGPSPSFGPYGAAKSGVINLTKTLSVELAPDVRVNAIAPGLVPTEMLFETMKVDESAIPAFARGITRGRAGTPEDIGACAVYLASRAADWVTGQTLTVSGGQ
ncbi:MAG: SDR family NAD(P)-dependent oxidoreductase [Dehalococcoidia bacterium]